MPGIAFLGGKIFTSDPRNSIVTGVYANEGRIRRVGPAEEVRKHLPPDTKIIEIGGKTLLPGLMDAHNHMVHVGSTMQQMDARYPVVGSVQELSSGIANAAEDTPEGEWIRGWGMDYAKYPGASMPTRWEIDDVSSRHPVVIVHTSGHFALVNSIALEQAGIDDNVQDPKGGRFVRDEKGRVTGMLLDSAQREVIKGAVDVGNHGPDPGLDTPVSELVDIIADTCKAYHKEGLTSIVDAQVTAREMPAYVEARNRGLLTVKTHCMYLSNHLKDVKALGVLGFMGDKYLSGGTIKCYSDGSLIGCTAAFKSPYINPPDTYGYTYWDRDELKDLLEDAHTSGLHTGTHGQGDEAMDQIVGAWEQILKEHPREDHRHRIEHCGYPIEYLGAHGQARHPGDLPAILPLLQRRRLPDEPRPREGAQAHPPPLGARPRHPHRPQHRLPRGLLQTPGQHLGRRVPCHDGRAGHGQGRAHQRRGRHDRGYTGALSTPPTASSSTEVGKAADFTLIDGDILNTPGRLPAMTGTEE